MASSFKKATLFQSSSFSVLVREEVFGQEYGAFVDSLTRTLNEELWNSVAFLEDDAIVTRDFFDIYYQIFAK